MYVTPRSSPPTYHQQQPYAAPYYPGQVRLLCAIRISSVPFLLFSPRVVTVRRFGFARSRTTTRRSTRCRRRPPTPCPCRRRRRRPPPPMAPTPTSNGTGDI